MSAAAYKQWENDVFRRKNTSERMSLTWENNRDKLIEHNKGISKKGAAASAEVVSKPIEYKGVIYKGWNRLKESTGVSKHLYLKYYTNGIDPTSRIDANGPISN